MSKIETLLKKLCPDGVEYKPLGEIGEFYSGLTGKSKEDFKDGNKIFITYMNVYSNPALKTDVADRVKIAEGEKQNTVQKGDVIFTGSSETPDECGMSSVLTEEPTEPLYLNSFCFGFRLNDKGLFEPDFLKHLFRSIELRRQIVRTASGVTRFNVSKVKMAKVLIPLPPIEIQREVVEILDKFAQLEAELAKRKKQYEHYRRALLAGNAGASRPPNEELRMKNEELRSDSSSWPRVKLGEVCEIRVGAAPAIVEDCGAYDFVNAGTTPSGHCKIPNTDGDTVTTPSRGQGGIGFVGYQKEPFWCGPLCYRIRALKTGVVTRFVYFYLSANSKLLLAMKKTGGIPALNMADLKTLPIPLPPLAEQERIVKILDRFDALCNSLSEGLPAEIERRKKQYAFYRDKLLTFRNKNGELRMEN